VHAENSNCTFQTSLFANMKAGGDNRGFRGMSVEIFKT
jgi:hypothetical protein